MSALDAVIGREYGPFNVRLSAAKVSEYVSATGDEAGRWTDFAPPSYAGALLFQAAPAFFADEEVAPFTRLLIHGEQQFEWLAPLPVGAVVSIAGKVERIRTRASVHFTTFSMGVEDSSGRPLLSARSTFLMSDAEAPGAAVDEREEPAAEVRGPNATPSTIALSEDVIPELAKSASRADLVGYAAASQDFNPIHWDHERAVEAGLGGVVVHGLLMAAWAAQAASRLRSGVEPLTDARFRFKAPMAAGVDAIVSASVGDTGPGRVPVTVEVSSVEGTHVAATIGLRDAPRPSNSGEADE